MKKIMMLALTVLMAMAVALPASAGQASAPGQQGKDKVEICHLPGHGTEGEGDYELYTEKKGGPTPADCEEDGGQVISVPRKAARVGHGVTK